MIADSDVKRLFGKGQLEKEEEIVVCVQGDRN
ncbi:hypothetical protein AJ81_08795 [Pseudothermotoga hypogea DSM 11164 = NBRC 106472]|uniref:Uncharacterized protein n=1 Tax=Pseudothermotoga hypogea DSM 11164 = NBRC 106472 TaxID=1123384 RepID=A0A0X1KUD2_9THEM|nr:hypothetical protein AJ81_08795 [Pseudothermotoga hypogea DSM 11164 = NBRC 106472]